MVRIALLLGAGFSCPFGYPTTKQFYEKLGNYLPKDSLRSNLFNSIMEVQGVKDIEHVLSLIDNLSAFNTNPHVSKWMERIIPQVNLYGNTFGWTRLIEESKQLKAKVLDTLFDEYHFKPSIKEEAFKGIDVLFNATISSITDIFNLNYDRLVEEYLLDRGISFVDGFSNSKRKLIWDPSEFNRKDNSTVRLFKIHGSLNWREREDEYKLECLSNEEPPRNSYYKQCVFIYPTQQCDITTEPYKTLLGQFSSIGSYIDVLIVIGYSFRDPPINDVIDHFIRSSKNKFVVGFSPTINEDIDILFTDNAKQELLNRYYLVNGKFPEKDSMNLLSEAIRKIKKQLDEF